jgi:hypothetical protein
VGGGVGGGGGNSMHQWSVIHLRRFFFQIESDDVGLIQKILIGHDGSNPMSGWHLTKVRLI